MGNKTNPNALRLGYIHDWESKWFSIKDAPALIGEDFKIRTLVRVTVRAAAVEVELGGLAAVVGKADHAIRCFLAG